MKAAFLAGIAALLLATGTAHAMQHDFSNTWCAKHIPPSAEIDREHYYAWIEKCHRRRGTKPVWKLPCFPDVDYPPETQAICGYGDPYQRVPLPRPRRGPEREGSD